MTYSRICFYATVDEKSCGLFHVARVLFQSAAAQTAFVSSVTELIVRISACERAFTHDPRSAMAYANVLPQSCTLSVCPSASFGALQTKMVTRTFIFSL